MKAQLAALRAIAERVALAEGKTLRQLCIESAWGMAFALVLGLELAALILMLPAEGFCP